MAATIRIHLDRHDGVFFAGEAVTGRVTLTVATPEKARAVSIHLRGEASVGWSGTRLKEHEGKLKSETVKYGASETYFVEQIYLLGETTGERVINPGEYEYNFEYLLPRRIPSSFEGEHGHIRYTAKAVMHRTTKKKCDRTAKAAFTVITHLDLNSLSQAKESVSMEETKSFCCLWWRSGPLSLNVHLPCGGYVPGQTIEGQIRVDNASNVRVVRVRCSLEQEEIWYSSGGRTKLTWRRLATRTYRGVEEHDSKVIPLKVPVPEAVPPSHLNNCSIIHVEYNLRVTAEVSQLFYTNLSCFVPILIGTIPVRGKGCEASSCEPPRRHTASAMPMPSAMPSAPPLYQAESPPPTYEESVSGDTMGQAPRQAHFTPPYPVGTRTSRTSSSADSATSPRIPGWAIDP